jgi:glycosyltransferase involved in cell wall biosynthesis
VLVEHNPRKYGKSGYSFSRLVKDFVLNIINNSSLPLRMMSYLGIALSVISFVLGIFYLVRYFINGTSIQGWTSLMVVMTFLSGFILLSLGIIGEYLFRILTETKKLPNYHEREKHL